MRPVTAELAAQPQSDRERASGMTRRRFALVLLLIGCGALALRLAYPVADPPTSPGIGIVWHDEGAWVHNARNRALFGSWTLDEWNPMYVTPILTGLEYVGFRTFGVGLRQARLVPELLGALSVVLIGLGAARVGNRLAGLFASALLATNFVYVMYNRAATIEATMVAFLVIAWYGYARAQQSARWGLLAGIAAIVAYFTKASAAFFVAALGLDALLTLALARFDDAASPAGRTARRGALFTLAGLMLGALVAVAAFVAPNWQAYRFYNWQTSVTRKPSYTLRSFANRASQLPLVSDFFTRTWLVLVVALGAGIGRLAGWRKVPPAERLLLWWLGLGATELVVHDIQDRYLLLLIPPLIALAALALGRSRLVPRELDRVPAGRVWLVCPVLFYVLYAAAGAVTRLPFMYWSDPGEHPAPAVRLAALFGVLAAVAICATWRRLGPWLAGQQWKASLSVLVVALVIAGDVAQYGQWARAHTEKNYRAMMLMAEWLPPGTLVHGKLANGLDLESAIRPVFVGRLFGNYADRTRRDDVRYLVTYVSPFVGYEGGRDPQSHRSVICDILDAYPNRRILRVFDVAESPAGGDAAVLVDKRPDASPHPKPGAWSAEPSRIRTGSR